MTDHTAVTMVTGAFHNPVEPRHFMRVVPAGTRCIATAAGHVVADSEQAYVVKEVGRDIYDPVVYFPRSDVDMSVLASIDKTTHCPLKGDTEYFDIVLGDERLSEAAWSYVDMIAADTVLDDLMGLVAFDQSIVVHTRH